MANYFVSPTGADGNAGTSAGAPWQTIGKVNGFAFVPGDIISFQAGGVWTGVQLNITRSGTSGNPITYNSYGSGAHPIITGLTPVSAWTSIGTNLWQSTSAISTLSTCNMVTIGGAFAPIGRWPDAVYATVSSFAANSATSVEAMPAGVTGGMVVFRSQRYRNDKTLITSQAGNTVNYTTAPNNPPKTGWGMFIINSQAVCTVQNEWWYDGTSKKLGMWSTSNPSGLNVQAANVDVLVNLNSSDWITFTGIDFIGSNTATISLGANATHIVFNGGCVVRFSGIDAIHAIDSSANNNTVTGCTIDWSNNTAIISAPPGPTAPPGLSAWTITSNTITNTGITPGMGASGDFSYSGITTCDANTIVQFNTIQNVGYNGIDSGTQNVTGQPSCQILNNLVMNACKVLDDGGGIYIAGAAGTTVRKVNGNIVLNSVGSLAGTGAGNNTHLANGIYHDFHGMPPGAEIGNNSVAFCDGACIFMDDSADTNIHDNNCYNTPITGSNAFTITIQTQGNQAITGLTVSKNVLVNNSTTVPIASYQNQNAGPSIATWGSIDNNTYDRPLAETDVVITWTGSGANQHLTIPNWRPLYGYDTNTIYGPSTSSASNIRFVYNATNSPVTTNLGATYVQIVNPTVSATGAGPAITSITLQPWTSATLIQTGSAPVMRPASRGFIIS